MNTEERTAILAGRDTLLIDKATGAILSSSRIEYDDAYWSVLDGEIDVEKGITPYGGSSNLYRCHSGV